MMVSTVLSYSMAVVYCSTHGILALECLTKKT